MDLIRQSLAGDDQAFEALFHQYKNLVYKTAYLMVDNAEDAADVLQDVFLQVHRSLATFQPTQGAFSTWLYRVTVNQCLNRRRKRQPLSLSLDETASTEPDQGDPSIEEQLIGEKAVWQTVSQLSEKLRIVVILRYYWGLPYAEIAGILRIPLGTVKSRLDLAIKTLRMKLGNEEALSQRMFFLEEAAR